MISIEFEKIINKQNLSPEEFGDSIGVGKSSIYKILRGDTKKLTPNMCKRINAKYPEYTLEYLKSLNYSNTDTIDTIKSNLSKKDLLDLAIAVSENEEALMDINIFSNIIHKRVSKEIARMATNKEEILKYLGYKPN